MLKQTVERGRRGLPPSLSVPVKNAPSFVFGPWVVDTYERAGIGQKGKGTEQQKGILPSTSVKASLSNPAPKVSPRGVCWLTRSLDYDEGKKGRGRTKRTNTSLFALRGFVLQPARSFLFRV